MHLSSLSRRSLSSLALAAGLLCALLPSPARPAETLAWRAEGPFLGTVVDVAFDARTPGLAYAAAANGGVFRSTDGGRNWVAAGRPKTNSSIEWLEVDPGTPGSLWLGVDNPGKPALWRSRDQGATWSVVTDNYRGQLATLHPVGYRIAFAPSRPADIWVPSTNLHYRSRDGGKSWSDFRVEGQDVYAMAVDPQNPDIVYAGGHGGQESGAAHLSRSDDGGKSWKPVGAGLEPAIHLLRVDPVKGATVYAASRSGKLWKSVDRGATFAALPVPIGATDDIYNLRFEPGKSGELWLASEKGLLRSADGGASWQRADRDSGRYLIHAVAPDPANPRVLLAASSGGGVYRSEDGGTSWAPSSSGLTAAWVRRIHAVPGSAMLFVQTATGLFRRDADGTWTEKAEPFEDDGDEVELDGLLFDGKSSEDGLGVRRLERLAVERWRPELPRAREEGAVDARPDEGQSRLGAVPEPGAGSRESEHSLRRLVVERRPGAGGLEVGRRRQELQGRRLRAAGRGRDAAARSGSRRRLRGGREGSLPHRRRRREVGRRGRRAAGSAIDLREVWPRPDTRRRGSSSPPRRASSSRTTAARASQKAGSALAEEDVEAVAVAPDGRLFAGSWRGVFTSRDGGATWISMSDGLPHRDVRALAVGGAAGSLRLWVGTAGGSVFSTPLP